MKEKILLKVITVLAVCLFSITSVSLNAQIQKTANNVSKIDAKTIYKTATDQFKTKYEYFYDNQSRLIHKEAFCWKPLKQKWIPVYRIDHYYDDQVMIIELACWNKKNNSYDLMKERSVYTTNEKEGSINCQDYKWDTAIKDWKFVENKQYNKKTSENIKTFSRQ